MAPLFEQYNKKEGRAKKMRKMTRRGFLGATAAIAATAAFPTVRDSIQETFNAKGLLEQINQKVSLIKKLYNIEIKSKLTPTDELLKHLEDIEDQEVSLAKFNRALDYLIDGFSKYPPFFVKLLQIRYIVVDDSLVYDGDSFVRGVTFGNNSGQRNNMFIEVSNGKLDTERWFGWKEAEVFKGVFHHEFFHAVVNALNESSDNSLSRAWLSVYESDAFEEGFVKNKKGFVSEYSQQDSIEDRSETFSAMMNGSRNIWERSKEGKALEKKVLFLQQVMFSNTFGLCNSEYWDFIRNGNLPQDFFKKRKAYLLSLDAEKFKQEVQKSDNWGNYLFVPGKSVFWKDPEIFEFIKKSLTEKEI